MIGIEFEFPVAELRKKLLFDEHIFVGSSSETHTMRLLPPLSVTKHDVDVLVEAMKRVLG